MGRRLTPAMATILVLASSCSTTPAAEVVGKSERHPQAPPPYHGRRKSKGRKRLPWEGKRR